MVLCTWSTEAHDHDSMAAHEFPMFRLATLLARQLSSPVAAKLKEHARSHPWFARHVCMGLGRTFLAGELRVKMWMLALQQPRQLPPVSDERALDVGTDLLGEIIIFGLGAAIILYEVNRQAVKQENKELDNESRWLALLMSLDELQSELRLQQTELDRLDATLRRLAPHYPRTTPAAPHNTPAAPHP